MQQQNPPDDNQFIYRYLSPVELTGVYAFHDVSHELGRGTSATLMKAISWATSEWWAVKIIYTQCFRASNNNDSDNNERDNNNNNRKDSTHFASLAREVSILETQPPKYLSPLRSWHVSWEVTISVSCSYFNVVWGVLQEEL
jgi:hypothetical protein